MRADSETRPGPRTRPGPEAQAASSHTDADRKPSESKPDEQPTARAKHRKRRASVPSWDEIMFGGPQPPD